MKDLRVVERRYCYNRFENIESLDLLMIIKYLLRIIFLILNDNITLLICHHPIEYYDPNLYTKFSRLSSVMNYNISTSLSNTFSNRSHSSRILGPYLYNQYLSAPFGTYILSPDILLFSYN